MEGTEVLLALAVIGVPATAIGIIINLILSYRLKNKMIEKGYVTEENQAVFKKSLELNHFTSLKWGLVIFFGGLGMVLLEFISYRYDSPFPFGFVAMFIALGFLIYFFILRKEKSNNK